MADSDAPTSSSRDTRWYWDLDRKCAVPASERGPGSNTLGPYDSKAEAQNWQQQVEARNDSWDDADDDWNDPERSGGSSDS